jgi:hypothetical protein
MRTHVVLFPTIGSDQEANPVFLPGGFDTHKMRSSSLRRVGCNDSHDSKVHTGAGADERRPSRFPQGKGHCGGWLHLWLADRDWLPAPKGPFFMIMRLYWPKEAATEGKAKQPPLQRVT